MMHVPPGTDLLHEFEVVVESRGRLSEHSQELSSFEQLVVLVGSVVVWFSSDDRVDMFVRAVGRVLSRACSAAADLVIF